MTPLFSDILSKEYFFKFIYLTDTAQVEGSEGERISSRLHFEHGVQCRAQSQNPDIKT